MGNVHRGRSLKQTNEEEVGKEALPSRAEYHRNRRKPKKDRPDKKKKMRVSIPLILLLVLLMLPIGILSIINSGDRSKANPVSGGSGEEVSFETEDPIANTDPEPKEADKDHSEDKPDSKSEEKQEETPAINTEKKPEKVISEKEKQEQQVEQDQNNTGGDVTYHTVQPGENLFRIALKYYNSQEGVEKIRQANGLAGNEISVGQKLIIPQP